MGPQLLAVVANATNGIWIDSGVFAFASTTLILSLYNAQTRGISTPNVVVGMAMFVGGLAQLLAGMWEVAVGNTFGATGKIRAPPLTHHPSVHSACALSFDVAASRDELLHI